MKLDGRVALVTGASRGIGRGIASRMAREGAAVVANYYRSESAGHELVEEIRSSGGKAIAVKADVGDYDQVKAMVERGVGEFGKLDIVVSNAGIFGPRKRLADITPEEFLEIINNHLIAAYNCAHTALPYLRQCERGDIQFISSRISEVCPPKASPYVTAKAAMNALAKSLAKEERYHGIRVNAIAPGLVETDINSDMMERLTGFTDMRQVDPQMPFGRMMQPEDIANFCVFLASSEGSHISGEVLFVRYGVGTEPTNYYVRKPSSS